MKLSILVMALLVAACTPSASTTATQVATVVEDVCIPVVSAAAPGDQQLCVLGDELANAIIAYIAAHAGAAPAVTTASGATVVPAEMYAGLAAKAQIKARAVRKCPVAQPGKVSP